MKAQLATITKEMPQDEQINTINENFEKLNEFQHLRETAILDRYNTLSSKVDGIANLLNKVHNDMIQRIDNRTNGLDTKINQVQNKINKRLDSLDDGMKTVLEWIQNYPPNNNLLTEDE